MPAPSSATETAALVLVDRCLDLVTPLSHADHLLDQIYGTLERRCAAGSPVMRLATLKRFLLQMLKGMALQHKVCPRHGRCLSNVILHWQDIGRGRSLAECF